LRRARPRPTALEWLLLIAGLFLTNHYAWLLEDAYIYFRYVDNLTLLQRGLVYNQGEFVEGFTSPAWALLLIPLRHLRLDYWDIVRGVGLASFATFWWLLIRLDREMGPPERDALRINFPLAYLAPCYGVLCYFTSGVESPLVLICGVAYALYLLDPERPWVSFWVGASPLIRPELGVALVMAVAFAFWRTRRIPVRALATSVLLVGGWLFFRIVYYADLLPNTFYLKDTMNYRQGLVYLHETLTTYGAYGVLPALLVLALALWRRNALQHGPARLAMLGIAGAIALYFVRIGGDPRHFRYLAFPFTLATAASAGLIEAGLVTFAPGMGNRWVRPLALSAAVTSILVFSCYPPQLGAHPARGRVPHETVNLINDAAIHRNDPYRRMDPWSFEKITPTLPEPRTDEGDWRMMATGICERAYRSPHSRIVHSMGLTDAILARANVPVKRPAHKPALIPLAEEILRVHGRHVAARGMYRRAVEEGSAASWMVANLDTIEVIERKIYNRHDFFENLALALQFPPRLTIESRWPMRSNASKSTRRRPHGAEDP